MIPSLPNPDLDSHSCAEIPIPFSFKPYGITDLHLSILLSLLYFLVAVNIITVNWRLAYSCPSHSKCCHHLKTSMSSWMTHSSSQPFGSLTSSSPVPFPSPPLRNPFHTNTLILSSPKLFNFISNRFNHLSLTVTSYFSNSLLIN